MIFSCGETWDAERARLSAWHKFFVLWPRTIGEKDGRYRCVWLQPVERRGTYCGVYFGWEWEYRLSEAGR